MAAKVGSLYVDLVANTAQFEAGMKQAANTTAATDRYITQKAWNAQNSTRRNGEAVKAYASSHDALTRSMGATTLAMTAQLGVSNRIASPLFLLSERLSMIYDESKRAAAASMLTASGFRAGATAAGTFANSVVALAAKLAALALGVFSLNKIIEHFKEAREYAEALDETTERYKKNTLAMAREVYDHNKKAKEPIDELIAGMEAGTIKASEWHKRVFAILDAEAEKAKADEYQKGVEIADRLFAGINERGAGMGIDLLTGREMTEFEQALARINAHYGDMEEQARKIADEETRIDAVKMISAARTEEYLATRARLQEEASKEAKKAHDDRMDEIRKQAAAIAAMFGRSADLVTGFGADAWKAEQEAMRQRRSLDMQATMLEKSGALDAEDKRTLRDMRDYLLELVRQQEEVSI